MKRSRKKLKTKTVRKLQSRDLEGIAGGGGTQMCQPTDGCYQQD